MVLSVSSVGSSPLQRGMSPGGQLKCKNFQYPRSDRAHCNPLFPPAPPLTPQGFQYPRSDRAHCNRKAYAALSARINLSVSSVGSSPLQHLGLAIIQGHPKLSVSSVGSSPLQPGRGSRMSDTT